MSLGYSRLPECVPNKFLIFGSVLASTECAPKVSVLYGEITIVGFKPLMGTL